MILGRARTTAATMCAALVLSSGACSDLPGPDVTDAGESLQFSQEIDLEPLEDRLTTQVRVEIRLGDDLVANRVEILDNGDVEAEEQISAPVSAAEITGSSGVITLVVGSLAVTFDGETATTRRKSPRSQSYSLREVWPHTRLST